MLQIPAGLLRSECPQVGHRVGSWRNDEYDRGFLGRGLEALLDAEQWRVYKEFAEYLPDPLLNACYDLVRADSFVNQDFLEWVQLFVPLAWEHDLLGIFGVVDGFEFFQVAIELVNESVETLHELQALNIFVHLRPSQRIDKWRVLRDFNLI